MSCLQQLRLQHPATPLLVPVGAANPSPTHGSSAILSGACLVAVSGLGIQNLSIIRALSGAASGVPEHIKMPKSEAPPHPISGGLCLRLHFRSPDRKWAGGSASRHLKATSCFPAALCQPWGCAPWLHPQSLPRALSQQLRGDRMVDMIAKLTRRKSRLPQGQVGDPCIEGS